MPHLPTLTTRDLNGDVKTLPDGNLNVLIVAYERPQQRQVDSWISTLAALELEVPGLRYYELPVVGAMSPARKQHLDFAMRQGIPDRDARARTLTFYVDRHQFRAPLGIDGESQIAVDPHRRCGQGPLARRRHSHRGRRKRAPLGLAGRCRPGHRPLRSGPTGLPRMRREPFPLGSAQPSRRPRISIESRAASSGSERRTCR